MFFKILSRRLCKRPFPFPLLALIRENSDKEKKRFDFFKGLRLGTEIQISDAQVRFHVKNIDK